MAERLRSKDGVRETERLMPEYDTPSQQGRAGGALEKRVGTRDEMRRADDPDATTRVRKSDEIATGTDEK